MNRDELVLERLRAADPAPDLARIGPDELSTIFSLLQERRGAMTTQTPIRLPRDRIPEQRGLRRAFAFGVALVVMVVAVGIGLFVLGGGDEDVTTPVETTVPAQTTTPAGTTPTTQPPAGTETTTGTTPAPIVGALPDLSWARAELAERSLPVGVGPGELFATVDGRLYTSSNGAEWMPVAGLPLQPEIASVVYGDGIYLAIGYDQGTTVMRTSSDLAEWTLVLDHNVNATSITYGEAGFVAVGEDAKMGFVGEGEDGLGAPQPAIEYIHAGVWVSADGWTWTQISNVDGVFTGLVFEDGWVEPFDVAFGPPGYVMVGIDDYTSDNAIGAVWFSSDGVNWQRIPHDNEVFGPPSMNSGVYSVTHGKAGFVATGILDVPEPYRSTVWFSPDGIGWERIDDQTALDEVWITDVTAIDGGYIAVGERTTTEGTTAAVCFSPDGRTWTLLPTDDAFSPTGEVSFLRRVEANSSTIVAYGFRQQAAENPPPDDPQAEYELVDTIWYSAIS